MIVRGVLFLALALLTAGCIQVVPKGPKTYPVKGKVTYADGTPYPSGLIEFRSTSEPYNAVGMIASDGTFTLSTLTEKGKLPGAAAGSFTATITPHMGTQQTATIPMPIELPGPFTVKPDDSNDLTIQLPASVRK